MAEGDRASSRAYGAARAAIQRNISLGGSQGPWTVTEGIQEFLKRGLKLPTSLTENPDAQQMIEAAQQNNAAELRREQLTAQAQENAKSIQGALNAIERRTMLPSPILREPFGRGTLLNRSFQTRTSPEALALTERAKNARQYMESVGWKYTPETALKFSAKLSGTDVIASDQYVDVTKPQFQQTEVRGAKEGSYDPYASGTFTYQEAPAPLTFNGLPIGTLPPAVRRIVEQAYRAGGGATSFPEKQTEYIFTGAPARVAQRAFMTAGIDERATQEFGWAFDFQEYQNAGFIPEGADPYGVWANLVNDVATREALNNLAAERKEASEQVIAVSTPGSFAKLVDDKVKQTGFWEGILNRMASTASRTGAASGGATLASTGATALSAPYNYVLTAYYAAAKEFRESRNIGQALDLAGAALIARPFGETAINTIGRADAAKKIWAIDSFEERAKLGIQSLGQDIVGLVTGNPNSTFADATPFFGLLKKFSESGTFKDTPLEFVNRLAGWSAQLDNSMIIDAAANIALDPFTYSPMVTSKFAKVFETGANLGVRAEARLVAKAAAETELKFATASYSHLGYNVQAVSKVPKTTIAEIVDEAAIRFAGAKGWIKPTNVLSEAEIAAARRTGRVAVIEDTVVGRSYFKEVENVVRVNGTDASRLKQTFRDWDNRLIQNVVQVARQDGTDAAMAFIRQAAINGEINVRITIRRQIIATVEGYLSSPGRQLGYNRATSKLIKGHSVPFIMGASPIKPFKGRTLRSFEKLAGRSNVWAPLVSKIFTDDFASIAAGFDEIASRLAGQEKQLVADRAKDIEQQLLADGIPTDASGFALRISRLVQIGTDAPDVIPGLDKLALALSSRGKGISDEAFGRAIRDLEVGVDIALSGSDEQLSLGAHLFASFAGSSGPADPFIAAQRRLNDIATVDVPRNQRFSDWLDRISTTEMPRRRQLDDWADISDPKYSLPFTPRFKRPVATLREAIREMEAEANRLIGIKGKRQFIYDAAMKSRENALARVARAINNVQTFAYRRAKHIADYQVKINTLREFYEESVAPIKAEAAKIKEEAEYLAGRRAQLKEQAKYSSWVQRPSSIREDGKYTAKNLVFSSRESYDADTLDWIARKETDLQARRAANRKAKSKLDANISQLKAAIKDDLDNRLNDPWINELEAQAADELAVARSLMKGKSVKKIELISKKNLKFFEEKFSGFPSALEQYAAIRQIDPDDISDPFIKNVVTAQRNLALNGVPQFPTNLEVVRRVAASRRQQIKEAISGQRLYGKVYNIEDNALGIMNRNSIIARAQNLPDILREYFENKIVEAIGMKQFDITDIARDVERFASNPNAADAVAAEMIKEDSLARWLAENARPNAKVLARQNSRLASMALAPIRFGANIGLSVMESIAPKAIRFISHPNASIGLMNRLEDLDRVAADWGMDSNIRAHMKRVAVSATSIDQLASEVSAMQRVWAYNMNVPYDVIRNRQNQIWKEAEIAFLVDAEGKVVRDLQVLSQKSNNLIVMSADNARVLARDYTANLTEAQAALDGVAWLGKGTVNANKIRQIPSRMLPENKAYTKFLKSIHPIWKGAVVTGAPTIIIGAGAGLIYGDPYTTGDDWGDRIKWAIIGAGLGSLGGIRYIGRVAGIEERLIRISLSRGFGARDWIPGYGKMVDSGLDLPARHLDELVSSSAHPLYADSYNKAFAMTDDVWDQVGPEDRFFIEAWARVVNRQLHPEVGGNVLDRVILQNFDNPNVNWREAAETWLTSPAGKNEFKKIGSINGKKRSMDSILDGYEEFITRYLPTPQIRDLRLRSTIDNPIPLENFKLWAKQGIKPDSVHAQKTWVLPRKGQRGQDAWLQARTYYRRFVMEKPTQKLNRNLMVRNVYSDEFRSLIRQGVAPDVARDIAEERAVTATNKVMFQLTDESRFAKKSDFFFPFQQPREELLRVYTSLVMENQARALRFTRLGATAFNNGTSSGLFYEDTQGEWRMRIPGSAWLSRVFDAPAMAGFDIKVRSLFFLLQGNAFSGSGANPDFNLGKPVDIFLGTMPAPGGPYWGLAASAASAAYPDFFSDLQKNHEPIFNRLFPYGTKSSLVRPEAIRLWSAFSQDIPPWEFGDRQAQRNSLVSIQQTVLDEMLYENKDNPNYILDLDSPETQAELRKRTAGLLLAWTVIGSVTPAPARPVGMGFKDMEDAAKLIKDQFGEANFMSKMYELRPDIAPIYFARSTEANDKGSFTNWIKTANYDRTLRSYNYIKLLEPEDYIEEFNRGRKQSEIIKAYNDAYNMPTFGNKDVYAQIRILDAKYADDKEKYGIDTRSEYFARKELAKIIANYNADTYENDINAWRQEFDVSAKDYKSWLSDNYQFRLNPYREARDIEQIRYGSGASEGKPAQDGIEFYKNSGDNQRYLDEIKKLPAAEQVKYWDYQIAELSYIDGVHDPRTYGVKGNAVDTANMAAIYRSKKAEVYANNPMLSEQSNWHVDTPLEARQKVLIKENGVYLDAIQEKISQTIEARNIAYEKQDWTTYRTLKQQLSALYDQRETIRQSLYDKFPDLVQLQKDMMGMVFLQKNPNSPQAKQAWEDIVRRYGELGVPMLVFGAEENAYLNSPPQIRAAMKQEIVERLNYEKGEFVVDGYDQKLYWENLTPFQKDLMENSPLSDATLEKWKSTSYASTISGGGGLGESGAALAYAQSLMAAYNKRPKGAVAPAAYAEYRLIPASDTAKRIQFLKDHEDVANWVRLGPLANMPPLDRILVINLMVKYGNWSGEAMSSEEMVNLAWADQQMQQWSRRGQRQRPTTYDTWINMPTGVDKAEYLKAHPEVQQWIADGPMANMPDMYKDVVKAIMQQYGDWSASTDPLGEVITQFYNTPKDLRADFLNEHPELREYWKALRSPEEQKIADLTEQYFSITDGTARRLFLSAHPELQTHFADSRIKKYERFLNQVSFYLGSNPSVFQEYLENQKSVTDELIARFGQKSLIRETLRTPGSAKASTSTSGRVRAMR